MKRIIVITGTPGTGKTTVSEKLARTLKNSQLIKANDVVRRKRLFTSHAKDGAMVVKMDRLAAEINKMANSSKADFVIIEGHLLCDMKIDNAVAIVLREHLATILKRLRKRRYSRQKIEDNIVSEGIDYCGVRAANHYRKVYEIEGGEYALGKAVQIAKGRKVKVPEIELLGELNGLLGTL